MKTREEVVAWAKQEYAHRPMIVGCMKKLLDTLDDDMVLYLDNDRALIGAVYHEDKIVILSGNENDYD